MTDIFISYARSTAKEAQTVAEALKALGYGVWRDDELPAHRAYAEVIEERLRLAKAVVVIWSADAAKSEWVQSEADRARSDHKLVQLRIDEAALPMPFDRIQCADMTGWSGDADAPGWRKVVASIADLMGGSSVTAPFAAAGAESALPLPSKPSIAVMPFANLSGDPDQEYFADGMVVEIVEALSRSRSIFVIASSSSLSFKGKDVSAQEAARQLGVRYILKGSVRKAGGRVRIGVELIGPADGASIWTHRFEDALEDIFDLQDKVALAVAGKIEPTVEQAEIRRASARPTDNMGSYDLYLRAVPQYRTFAKDGTLAALDLLDRAIAVDPNFGPALSHAASCHRMIHLYRWSEDPEHHRQQSLDLAHRALKAAGDDADVLARVATILAAFGDDQDAALALLDRAIALNPGSSLVWALSSFVRLRYGQTDLSLAQIETSLRLDPMGPNRAMQVGSMGQAVFLQKRFREALPMMRESVQQAGSAFRYALFAACLGHLGQVAEARAALAHFHSLTPQPIADTVRSFITDPGQLTLVLDGIALAEGKGPADGR